MREKVLIGWLNSHPQVTELDVWTVMAILGCGYATAKRTLEALCLQGILEKEGRKYILPSRK